MKTLGSKEVARVWLTWLAVFMTSSSAAAADERAKRDADNAVQLCEEMTKIAVPAGWNFANRLKIAPAVSREPRMVLVIESGTPLLFKHIEIGAPPRADDEPEKPPILERVEIRLVAMPYLSPDERAAAAKRNEQCTQRRLEFERQHLQDIPFAWKGPRPFPPWAYAVQDVRGQQLDSLHQYMFLWLRTEPVLLPSHHYKTLAFRLETSPWGTISDKQKMKEFRDLLAALQQIVVPYEEPAADRRREAGDDAQTRYQRRETADAKDGEAASKPLAKLIADLESNDADTRRNAIHSLAGLGSEAKPAVQALTRILENRQAPFRADVASAFNHILPPHVDIFALFPDLRFVGKVPPVANWPPDRRAKFEEANRLANEQTAKALETALPALVDALRDDDDEYVRQYAAMSIGACRSLAKNAVSALIQALEDKNEAVRMRSVEALGRIGPDAGAAVGPLMKYVKTRSDDSTSAIRALGAIGPPAKGAVPTLVDLLHDARAPRYAAAEALGNIGRDAETAIPALVTALNDKDRLVRACAAEAIGKIGSRTPVVVAALEEAAKDEDSYVRLHAERALKQLSSAREEGKHSTP